MSPSTRASPIWRRCLISEGWGCPSLAGVLMLTVGLERVDRDDVRSVVAEQGAMRIRGLELRDAADAEAVFRQLGTLMTGPEAFAPRTRYAPGVYSATKWPPNQPMCVHHELSYAYEVPSLMLFACLVTPAVGGATPLADGAAVLGALPRDLVERFERQGWLLVRNYNDDIGASIADVFGTNDRDAVERYCRANAIDFEWQDGGGGALRKRQRSNAVVRIPHTGPISWVQQIEVPTEWNEAQDPPDIHG